jgi:hypothetical protein
MRTSIVILTRRDMQHQAFSVGEKVKVRGQYGRFTIEYIQGTQVFCKSETGNKCIADVSDLTPFILKASNGWYTVAGKAGFAYYINWDPTTGKPEFEWGLSFATQMIEPFPKPFGLGVVPDVFTITDFSPIKLTTQRR